MTKINRPLSIAAQIQQIPPYTVMPDAQKNPANATRSKIKAKTETVNPTRPFDTSKTQRGKSPNGKKQTIISGAERSSGSQRTTVMKRNVPQRGGAESATDEHESDTSYQEGSDEEGSSVAANDIEAAKIERPSTPARGRSRPRVRDDTPATGTAIAVEVPSKSKSRVNPNSKRQQLLKKDGYIKKLKAKMKDLEGKLTERDEKIKEKNNTIEEMEEEHIEEKERFNAAHASYLKLLKKGTVNAVPDNDVAAEFDGVMAMCKSWARKYAVASFDELNAEELKTVFRLSSFRSEPTKPFASERALKALQDRELSPITVLNSVVNRLLCSNTFERPFFLLGPSVVANKLLERNIEEALDWVLSQGETSSEKKSNFWRALTVRIVDPVNGQAPSTVEQGRRASILKRKNAFYTACAQHIEDKVRGVLRKSLDGKELQKRQDDLVNIVRRAGTLSSKLAAQKVKIQILFYSDLKDFVDGTFTNGSDLMEPHPSMHCDEEDTSFDGWTLDLVVQPLFIGWGDEQGENYDEYKIWSKALVLALKRPDVAREVENATTPKRISKKAPPKGSKNSNSAAQAIVILDDENSGSQPQKARQGQKVLQKNAAATEAASTAKAKEAKTQSTATVEATSSASTPKSKPDIEPGNKLPSLASSQDAAPSTAGKATDKKSAKTSATPKPTQSENKATANPAKTAAARGSPNISYTPWKRAHDARQDSSGPETPAKRPRTVSPVTMSEEVAKSDGSVEENAGILKEPQADQAKVKQDDEDRDVINLTGEIEGNNSFVGAPSRSKSI